MLRALAAFILGRQGRDGGGWRNGADDVDFEVRFRVGVCDCGAVEVSSGSASDPFQACSWGLFLECFRVYQHWTRMKESLLDGPTPSHLLYVRDRFLLFLAPSLGRRV